MPDKQKLHSIGARLRVYYGTNNTDCISLGRAIGLRLYEAGRGNLEVSNRGPLDHYQTLLNALPDVQSWFNQTP